MVQTNSESIRMYIIEEQEIYREIYKYALPLRTDLELLRITDMTSPGTLAPSILDVRPDVLLLSAKKLDAETIGELERIRSEYPQLGIVILLVSYSSQDIDLLRRLALIGDGGMALFLKQSLDQIDQIYRTILAVSQGQVILDPILATYMFAGKPECPFLKQLTAREMEILSLLSQGYTNSAIAGTLYIDIKTVEHHLNSMYSKLKADPGYNNKHLRVSAARIYLETMGETYHREPALAAAGR